MTILKAICDRCGKVIESTSRYEIGVDYNNEILCVKCRKEDDRDKIRKDIEDYKSTIIHINETIDDLEAEIKAI